MLLRLGAMSPQHRPHDSYANPHGYGLGHHYRTRRISPIAIVAIVFGTLVVCGTFGAIVLALVLG
jgi:hypothetical protein